VTVKEQLLAQMITVFSKTKRYLVLLKESVGLSIKTHKRTHLFCNLHTKPDASAASPSLSTWHIFWLMTWHDKRMMAFSQAGLVEKFVDALVWIIWPLYMNQKGLALPAIGWVVGSYGMTWGVAQLLTGHWSDLVGRHRLNVAGMWLCGLGVALFPLWQSVAWWSGTAALTGLGMAMLYPNLSAAVVDHAAPAWRASAIGIYRFWRDIGYAVGAAGIGVVAFASDDLDSTFYFVAISMLLSGALLAWRGQDN
jgi:MFS family permease